MPELTLSSSQLLSGIAALLLVFVSGGVIYLSTVEWRDRRRRKALETTGQASGRSSKSRGSTSRSSAPRKAVGSSRRP